jgi:hypothetical protein
LPSMPDLSLPDFSDATDRVMSEFNIFTSKSVMLCRSSNRWATRSRYSK